MKTIKLSLLASILYSNVGFSQFLNPGFETNFTNWSTIGDGSQLQGGLGGSTVNGATTSTHFGSTIIPQEGTLLAQLCTGGTKSITDIETFANVSSGTIESVDENTSTNGTCIKQQFYAIAGDVITFKIMFGTDESMSNWSNSIYGDNSFFSVSSSTYDTAFKMDDTDTLNKLYLLMGSLDGGSSPNSFVNIWRNYSYTFPTTDTFTLAVGILNNGDNTGTSYLLLDEFNFTTSLGINKNLQKSNFSIYPNPASQFLNIKFTENENHSVVITDMNGKFVSSSNFQGNCNSLDISNLESGIYFIKDTNTEYSIFQKFVIL